jgi:hypothetical protein
LQASAVLLFEGVGSRSRNEAPLHAFGKVANGRAQVRRETFNGEQQVALSRVNACVVSRHFAEVQLGDYGDGK